LPVRPPDSTDEAQKFARTSTFRRGAWTTFDDMALAWRRGLAEHARKQCEGEL